MITAGYYFLVSTIFLFVVAVISLYNFIGKKQLIPNTFLILLEVLTIFSVGLFIFKFSIYKHICILTSLGLNLLNLSFIGLLLSFLFSIFFKIRPLFSILSPLFFIIYVVGFIKSLNAISPKTSQYTILTYIHITLFTAGIVFNLLSLICFFLEKYLYSALKSKEWWNIVFITGSIEKIRAIGIVCFIVTLLVFGLGLLIGTYRVLEKYDFLFFIEPLSIGSIIVVILLLLTYISRIYSITWLSYFNVSLISNIIIFMSYILHLVFNIGKHA